jgi:erythromycin esterase-like protein
VTLDTERDFELLKEIYADLYHGAPISVLDLVAWLRDHLEHRECRDSA